MDDRVAKLKTPEECEEFAKNVRERGRPDLAQEAVQRSIQLRAAAYGAKTKAEQECLEGVYAYEQILSAKNRRRTTASRTWQMIRRHGILKAVERAVNRDVPTLGYKSLVEMGLQRFAFESVVVRYPGLFSQECVRRSRQRMSAWETEVPASRSSSS
jgi:hypothetical protein